jgi:hypothetical protein
VKNLLNVELKRENLLVVIIGGSVYKGIEHFHLKCSAKSGNKKSLQQKQSNFILNPIETK